MRYRKGELAYYKSCLPKELKTYMKDNPENIEYIKSFLDEYKYNYVQKKWVKRDSIMPNLRKN